MPFPPAERAQDERNTGVILLADSDASRCAALGQVLRRKGYAVRRVCDGATALDIVPDRTVDLVLADAGIPDLDQLREVLRGSGAQPGIPLVLLTSNVQEEIEADDYLVRPFSNRELMARVATHVRMSRLCADREETLKRQVRQFETLLTQIPMGIFIADSNFRVREANKVAIAAFGEIPGGLIGRDLSEVIRHVWQERYADEILAIFHHTVETGEAWAARERGERRRDSGLKEYFEWRVDRIPLADGGLGVVCYFRNVGERRRAEQNANLLASIVESSEDAIVSKNLNGRILSWNRGAEHVFGYSADEAVGQQIEMLIPPDRLQEEPHIITRMKRGERVEHFETVRLRKDGRRINVSLTISPLRDANGRIVGASKVARDVTARVRQEQELQRANRALERANADLQHFAWSASHDLQEPLRMVAIYSELLRRKFAGQLGATGDEYIGYTVLGAKRMENLLRNLRTYTHVSTLAAPAEEVDTAAIFSRTLQNLAAAIEANGAKIECGTLPKVRIYEFQLEQIFLNLIANALRYRTDAVPEIAVAAERRGNDWLFSVRDNGIGIEPKFHDQIFGVFKRLHGAADYSGTGMGLAICQRAIERAGGRIWVESAPNRGSTFYFTVPAAA
ncbi:MAG TPA: PAS domain S-box protein [Bryobacteraceae bacterium]|nr:PAS domain S-box protein [Bryobacteraceae bacterium]